MPKGPQGQTRPADVIGAAVLVGKISTSEVKDICSPETAKDWNPIAKELMSMADPDLCAVMDEANPPKKARAI